MEGVVVVEVAMVLLGKSSVFVSCYCCFARGVLLEVLGDFGGLLFGWR